MTFGIASEPLQAIHVVIEWDYVFVYYLDFLVEVISTLATKRQNRITSDIVLLSILLKLLLGALLLLSQF